MRCCTARPGFQGLPVSDGVIAPAEQEDIWLTGAHCLPSPNFDDRPVGASVSLLVVHNISLPPGEFGGGNVQRFFCNQLDHSTHPFFAEIEGLEVSSHFLISRGGALWQFVPLNRRAWHAGASSYLGRERCNDFSIGIELEGCDDLPYTDTQYVELVSLTRRLQSLFPDIGQHLAGHSDIAPGRKTDPGPAFDWQRYRTALEEESLTT